MSYDRTQAIGFASDFWDRPCKSDNHAEGALGLDEARDRSVNAFWNKSKAPADKFELHFVFNEKTDRDDLLAVPKAGAGDLAPVLVVDGEKLEDCAHFLSECLKAGGLGIKEQWSVPMLLMALRETEDSVRTPIAKTLADKVDRATAQNVIDSGLFKVGDMIGYFTRGGYQHSTMYTGKLDVKGDSGHVTCHTKSRFMGKTPKGVPDEWFLSDPTYSFTLVHIAEASEAHPPPLGDKLAGWWQIGKGEFYYVSSDGRAMRTASAPKDGKAPRTLGSGGSRGYWFAGPTEAKFCWRSNGSVVTMKPAQDGKSAQVFGASAGPATATRLDVDAPKKDSR